ncbi:hypothetical protein ACLB2K_041996 [Fragaria x ananassa]
MCGIKIIFFAYFRRIFKNIFSHAEQISQAMIARGFRGDCNTHKMCCSLVGLLSYLMCSANSLGYNCS